MSQLAVKLLDGMKFLLLFVALTLPVAFTQSRTSNFESPFNSSIHLQIFSDKVVCYWQAMIDADLINPHICTHIIYAFVGVDHNGSVNFLMSDGTGESIIQDVYLK